MGRLRESGLIGLALGLAALRGGSSGSTDLAEPNKKKQRSADGSIAEDM